MEKRQRDIQKEELGNALTHGIGAFFALAGLVILIVLASSNGTPWHIIGFTIFGSMMVLLYSMSTIYHSIKNERLKNLFRKFDHMSIFLFIAASYTPFCLVLLTGSMRWIVLGLVWGCAIFGVAMKVFHTGKKELLSTMMYIAMGWIAMIFIKPLYDLLSWQGFTLLMLGGLFYTFGTIFYMKEKIRYNHVIWHLFVLGGSTFHYFSVLTLL